MTPLQPELEDPQTFVLGLDTAALGAALARPIGELNHHVVELEVVDAVGRRTVRTLPFRLRLDVPPVWVGQCALARGLDAYQLSDATLGEMYQGDRTVAMLEGAVAWPVSGEVPTGALRLFALPTALSTQIVALGEDKHVGPGTNSLPGPLDVACLVQDHWLWRADGLSAGCGLGPAPAVRWDTWTRDDDGVVNVDGDHDTAMQVRARGVWEAVGRDGVVVPPNQPALFEVSAVRPVIALTSGVPYIWPRTMPLLPRSYTPSPAVVGYRVPLSFRRNRPGTSTDAGGQHDVSAAVVCTVHHGGGADGGAGSTVGRS